MYVARQVLKNLVNTLNFRYYLFVRIFKNKWFHRFSNKEGITDNDLKEVVKQLEKGQYYANLGGEVYKMQIARLGEGKREGYRVIVVFKSAFRTFFVYGFPKSKTDNIDDKELKVFKSKAKDNLAYTDEQINRLLVSQNLIEILQEGQK
jgi:hypothetical protein